LAVSDDLHRWRSLSPDEPSFSSPHASKSLRYLDAKLADGKVHLFYEFARPDGAHDLRMITCDAAAIAAMLPAGEHADGREEPNGACVPTPQPAAPVRLA
jgi:hypothetical protein